MPTSPAVVGFVRGLIEGVVIAALAALVAGIADLPADLAPYAGALVALVRTVEGIADRRIDPTKQRGVLGGKPAEPTPDTPL